GRICAVSFDTTASPPVRTDREGTPLALLERFADTPNAMFVVWKDHTGLQEAEEITAAARQWHTDYTLYSGGSYSCEWAWAKMLHCLRCDASLRDYAASWIEHSDWIGGELTGNRAPGTVFRNRCAAGHKAMWNGAWGGLPPLDFWQSVDPLYSLFAGNMYETTHVNGTCIGVLTEKWLKRFGLKGPVKVGIGAIDCHIGAIGSGIGPGILVKVAGTSTCDIALMEGGSGGSIEGICGQVDGSVLPGYTGLEAGQSAFGDIYNWYAGLVSWNSEGCADSGAVLLRLSEEAAQLERNEGDVLAVDWFNGRRTPDADHRLRGAIAGLTIGTTAPEVFASLVEATVLGSRAITERLMREGVEIREIVATGGIAVKSPYVMQTMADVLGMPIRIAGSTEACALGAAVCAAVAAGIYPDIESAQRAMVPGDRKVYRPDSRRKAFYDRRYGMYRRLGGAVKEVF
ncbi:MAG: ribulokinase, partial [Rikenellaceae bacterium]|nr:ribulokinase [Rikenellaceae bacterium]